MIKTDWKILIIFSLTIVVFCGSWQSNPFDINNRKKEALDINVPEQVIVPPRSESLKGINDIQEGIQDTTIIDTAPKTSFLEIQQQKLIGENPFNVSHIPLRKTEKEESRTINKSPKAEKKEIKTTKPAETQQSLIAEKGPTNKFIFWLLLLQLLITTSLLSINREFISKVSRSISNDNFAKLVSRDYNAGYNPLFVLMYIIFLLSLSIFVYLTVKHYSDQTGFSLYLKLLLVVSGVYMARHIFQGFVSFVFPFQKMSSYYNFMIILFNSFLGLLLIPINLIIAYAPSNLSLLGIYLGFGIFGIIYLLRFLRGCLHSYTFIRNYLFHFFLYLCTCEFAPVVILVKLLSKSFFN